MPSGTTASPLAPHRALASVSAAGALPLRSPLPAPALPLALRAAPVARLLVLCYFARSFIALLVRAPCPCPVARP